MDGNGGAVGEVKALPYGSWPSPLSAELLASGSVRYGGVAARGSTVWWVESRPEEGGRAALVVGGEAVGNGAVGNGAVGTDVLGNDWSVRTRIHEYGGAPFWLGRALLFFVNDADQCVYALPLDALANGTETAATLQPQALTEPAEVPLGLRYGDGCEVGDGAVVIAVREDHTGHGCGGSAGEAINEPINEPVNEPVNELVAIAADGSKRVSVLVTGADFYAAPRVSPDGRWLSWVEWNHPNMPWDETMLRVAPITGDLLAGAQALGPARTVAGGEAASVHGAAWTSGGDLVFSHDVTGFWNLDAWTPGDEGIRPVTELSGAEIGAPAWSIGTQRWDELADGRLMAVVTTDAVDSVVVIDRSPPSSSVPAIETVATEEHTFFSPQVAATDRGLVAVAAGPTRTPEVIEVRAGNPTGDSDRDNPVVVHRPAADLGLDPAWFSRPEAISFDQAHAFFYPPTAPGITGPGDDRPPLIVIGHGGPTSHTSPAIDLKIQFWTTRGFAVVDVNYRGSSGYGRAFRQALNGGWGLYDTADCVAAATYLADADRVDPDRMVIRGSSAGGLTVLSALISSDIFAAGTSLYGVADLRALAADTHKFESRYLDGMIGPYPEAAELYDQRSPINHTERLRTPMLVMQGLEDKVVPPSQSEAVVAALEANGVTHRYVTFPTEGHGFRQAENMVRAMTEEYDFYHHVLDLGAAPADH